MKRWRVWWQQQQAARITRRLKRQQARLERKCAELGEIWSQYEAQLKQQGVSRQQRRAVLRDLIAGRWQVVDWLGNDGKTHTIKAH